MDSIGAPENLLIFGEEEEEQSASIHNVDSLSDASSDDDMSSAVDVSRSRDIETSDVVSDSVPTWYIPAEIPDSLKAPFGAPRSSVRGFGEEEAERSASISRADSRSGVSADDRSPMRTTASGCLTDSILTFNADSVLTEATIYDYDASNRTIRTTVWKYDVTGGILGTSSKTEYCFDTRGDQVYTASYTWNTATNDWKGSSKTEFVYNEVHKMESQITYSWVNNTWLPQNAYVYDYDAVGNNTEYATYSRSGNHLVPKNRYVYAYNADKKKLLEEYYGSYSNGSWAGKRSLAR